MKRAAQLAVFVLCVVFSVAGAYNVMSDNTDVVRMATAVACDTEGAACNGQVTRMERNPIAQQFEITTRKRKVDVRCTRDYVFLGEYNCALR